MKITNQLGDMPQVAIFILFMSFMHATHAEALLSYLTDSQYTGPSLEDNVVLMDTDKNGFADVFEVRAFLELKHGKGYEKDLLDKLEASASGKSCSTPFAKELYGDQTTSVRSN